MKQFIQYGLLLSLLALAACGKNKSGGQQDTGYFSSINYGQLSEGSSTALNNYINWYNTPQENFNAGLYTLTYVNATANTSNGCTPKDIKIGGVVIGQYYICSGTSSSSSGTQTTCKVAVLASNAGINVKPSNPILSAIANGQMGTLVQARQQGTIFNLDFQKSTGQIVSYMIDTNLHSSMQPVQIVDYSAGIFEYLGSQPMYGALTTTPFCNP